jgi:hypothetical protein
MFRHEMKRKTQKRGTEIKMGTKIRKQEHGKKLRASCGKTETGLQGKDWLSDDLRKVRHLRTGMRKLRPAGQVRPVEWLNAARGRSRKC